VWIAVALGGAVGLLATGWKLGRPRPVARELRPGLAAKADGGSPLDQAPEARVTCRGRVEKAGRPVAEALVELGGVDPPRSTRSAADGSFAFGDLPSGTYALRATLGTAAAFLARVEPSMTARLELAEGWALTGTLRDQAGRPIAGGRVTCAEGDSDLLLRRAATEKDGAFRIAPVVAGEYRVHAQAEGFLGSDPRTVIVGAARPPASLDLRLERGATVIGRVLDESGHPVAAAQIGVGGETSSGEPLMVLAAGGAGGRGDARLEAQGELGVMRGPIPYPPLDPSPPADPRAGAVPDHEVVRTDASGEFRVTGLAAGRLVIAAWHPDFARSASDPMLLSAGATAHVELRLRRGATVRGRVTSERGDPIAGVELSAAGLATAVSDGHGDFQFDHLLVDVTLTAKKRGYLPGSTSVAIEGASVLKDVQLTLRAAEGRLGGVVVDDRGGPVAGARVEIAAPPLPAQTVMSDPRGRFRADGLSSGPYRVTVTHADFAELVMPDVAPTEDARVVLAAGGGISGEVRDARSGGLPVGARGTLELSGQRRALTFDRAGRFTLSALPSGPGRLTVEAPGYVTFTRDLEIPVGERAHEVTVRDLRVELERGGVVVGAIRSDRGDPVEGVEVTAGGARGRSDARGQFRLEGVSAGRVAVTAEKAGQSVTDEVEVREADQSRVDLILR
jgi:hypothetical protein